MADILSLGSITLLALVNSVNPCQIAMLVLVLITILIENNEKRRKVLFTGFAFVAAVFIGYLVYGIILVQLFQAFNLLLKQGSVYIKDVFAVLSMLFGALQIKDFFFYKKGSLGTEMPIWMRPKAKKFIEKITSPGGAFITGFVITLFLGPCTTAPLLVATETLSTLGLLGALPWLLYFNLIAVLPLIIITLIVYAGFTSAESVSRWKDRNVRILHLIAGLLLLAAGLALLMGWL